MAAAFLAMNEVFGPVFDVSRAEAADAGRGRPARAGAVAGSSSSTSRRTSCATTSSRTGSSTSRKYAKQNWNPALWRREQPARATSSRTTSRRSSSTATPRWRCSRARPSTTRRWDLLTNDQIAAARASINKIAGSRRLLGHAVFTPKKRRLDGRGRPRDRDAQARQLEGLHDRRSALPVQARLLLAARRREAHVPVLREGRQGRHHHHLHPQGPAAGRLREVVAAARGSTPPCATWARRPRTGRRSTSSSTTARSGPFLEPPDAVLAEFEKTGPHRLGDRPRRDPGQARREERLRRARHRVRDLRGDEPALRRRLHRHARQAASAPTTCSGARDSVWYGSPQWQIEALRRLEIPEDMQKKHGFAPLGPADGPVKRAIFGGNSARLYGLDAKVARSTPSPTTRSPRSRRSTSPPAASAPTRATATWLDART